MRSMDDIEAKRIDRLLEEVLGDLSRYEDRESAIADLIALWRERGEALLDAAVHLAAAISLLESGGKKAAPSDKMFAQMLCDYKASLDRARAALSAGRNGSPGEGL